MKLRRISGVGIVFVGLGCSSGEDSSPPAGQHGAQVAESASASAALDTVRARMGVADVESELKGVQDLLTLPVVTTPGDAFLEQAFMLNVQGSLIDRSEALASLAGQAILRSLNEHLPPSGAILQALARFDPFPQIEGPRPDVGPPNSKIARDPQVRSASASVVKVLGTACGLGVQGSGW